MWNDASAQKCNVYICTYYLYLFIREIFKCPNVLINKFKKATNVSNWNVVENLVFI